MVYTDGNIFALNALLNKIKGLHFSVQTQYKFLKILKAVQSEIEIFDQQRQSLIKDYAELDENGNIIQSENGGIKIKEDKFEECSEKIREINSIQIQFPDIYFSLDELEPLGLTLEELSLLDPFIKD